MNRLSILTHITTRWLGPFTVRRDGPMAMAAVAAAGLLLLCAHGAIPVRGPAPRIIGYLNVV